jgi:hypothetical protein
MSATTRVTARTLSQDLNVPYAEAAGFLKVAHALGAIATPTKLTGQSGKGKPSLVYELPASVTVNFANLTVVPMPAPAPVAATPVAATAPVADIAVEATEAPATADVAVTEPVAAVA